jgi:hypothetical protein
MKRAQATFHYLCPLIEDKHNGSALAAEVQRLIVLVEDQYR